MQKNEHVSDKKNKKNLLLAQQQQSRQEVQHVDYIKRRIIPNNDPTTQFYKVQAKHIISCVATAQGQRPYQEDRYGLALIDDIQLQPYQLAEILYHAVIQLSKKCESISAGSTLSAFIYHHNYIVTSNVGDSRIILMAKKNNTFVAKRLTWDHKPYEEVEFQRIKNTGGHVLLLDTYRLNGVLAVSRALGDAQVGPGLSNKPDITWSDVSHYREGYIIACTDGITDALDEIDIVTIFKSENRLSEFASMICKEAYRCGSTDNVTVIITPLSHMNNSAIFGFVTDGHGGSEVADYIQANFAIIFYKQIVSQSSTATLRQFTVI